jgi:hypothetical protein
MDRFSAYCNINYDIWKTSPLAVHLLLFPLVVSTYCDIIRENMESPNNNTPKFRPHPSLKLMDQVRAVLGDAHDAYRTEQTSGPWRLRSIHYLGGKPQPTRLGTQEVECGLFHLATESQVSASSAAGSESPGGSLPACPAAAS